MGVEKMLQFIAVDQQRPDKRSAEQRVGDFREIYDRFTTGRAAEQASRCSQCGIPFCQVSCPLNNNIPDWLLLTANGRLEEAYGLSSATNTFPEICGRVCPQDRLCEGNCVIQPGFQAVTIGAVEKHIADTAFEQGWVQPPHPIEERNGSVGIIGGGPAGLAAADRLRRIGYDVHIYDRHDRMGGLLMYGIPSFKLEKSIVNRRSDLLQEAGVVFHNSVTVGRDAALDDLRRKHNAILIATGVYNIRTARIPGAGLRGIHPWIEFLTAAIRKELGDIVPEYEDGTLDPAGRNVVVIGGGDTAMDCVRTALRGGARSVKCLYRRDRANMPGSRAEVANAEEEGAEFQWLSAPKSFVDDDGKDRIGGVQLVRMRLGAPDASGRQVPQVIEGSMQTVPADMVILALGSTPEDLPTLFVEPSLQVSEQGTLTVDPETCMTSLRGVFAAGDIVRGSSLVVWAIRDGRDAADQIHAYIEAKRTRTVTDPLALAC